MSEYNSNIIDQLTPFYDNGCRDVLKERFDFEDISYAKKVDNSVFLAPLVVKSKCIIGTRKLSLLPCPFFFGTSNGLKKKCIHEYVELVKSQASEIYLRQDPLVEYDSDITSYLLESNFVPHIFFTTIIDLELDEQLLWANIRKSYHSLINSIEKKSSDYSFYIVASNENNSFIDDWIALYIRLLARGGNSYTDLIYIRNSISNGKGKLYLLYKNNELISGSYFTYSANYAYYSSSGTKPEYENSGYYSHFLMWKAILDLKRMGIKKIEVGPIFYPFMVGDYYSPSQKEISISKFKLGCGGQLKPFIVYEYKKNV